MSRREKLLARWKNGVTDELKESVLALLKHYGLEPSGPHNVIRDSRLADHPRFLGTLTVPVSRGQKVKGVYLRHIVEALEWMGVIDL